MMHVQHIVCALALITSFNSLHSTYTVVLDSSKSPTYKEKENELCVPLVLRYVDATRKELDGRVTKVNKNGTHIFANVGFSTNEARFSTAVRILPDYYEQHERTLKKLLK